MPFRYEIRRIGGPINPLIGCLPVLAVFFLMCLIPLAIYDVGRAAFEKLGLSPQAASLAIAGVFIGSLFNIPVYEIRKDELQPQSAWGPLGGIFPKTYQRVQSLTVIAVNVGGCVIPVIIAGLQVIRLLREGQQPFLLAMIVTGVSIFVCYWFARPMEGIGILMPGFIPPLTCVTMTWLLLFNGSPDQRAATAFLAGVAGPVIGADLLHLKDLTRTPVAVMSIGGAGTFDGIVLSGILAALLA